MVEKDKQTDGLSLSLPLSLSLSLSLCLVIKEYILYSDIWLKVVAEVNHQTNDQT